MAGGSTRDLFKWTELNSTYLIDGETWRVLTADEWRYLLVGSDPSETENNRPNANDLNALGQIEVSGGGVINGLIILPDGWIQPSDVPAFNTINSVCGIHYTCNHYTSEQWEKMEAAGAVFLPCGGYGLEINKSTQIENVADHGTYWSTTANSSDNAYRIQFDEGIASGVIHDYTTGAQSNYYSVRLVREVTALDENDESTTFSTKMGSLRGQSSVQIFRTLYKDGSFNTLCLPFNVPSISSSPLNGAEVYTFESGEVVNNVLQLDITQVTSNQLTKGVPYLIRWANDGTILGNMEFTGLGASDWDDNCSADEDAGSTSVKYHGFYYKTHLRDETDGAGNHYNLFLGADDELYWPTDGGVLSAKMKGFRAHFYIVTGGEPTGSPSAAPWRGMPAMLRIVSRDNTVTGTEQVEIQQAVEKAIRDGRIVLIIDGETYNMGGQRL